MQNRKLQKAALPLLLYILINCCFFASNSSCVITPLSSSSLYFFNSSAPLTFCIFVIPALVSCLSSKILLISAWMSAAFFMYINLIVPEEVETITPCVRPVVPTAEIMSKGKSTRDPKPALPYTRLSVTTIEHRPEYIYKTIPTTEIHGLAKYIKLSISVHDHPYRSVMKNRITPARIKNTGIALNEGFPTMISRSLFMFIFSLYFSLLL